MKKKIALLLAGTMVLSTMPLGVFANSVNSVSLVAGIDKRTLFTNDRGTHNVTYDALYGDVTSNAAIATVGTAALGTDTYRYNFVAKAPRLLLKVDQNLTTTNGDFSLYLNNAVWTDFGDDTKIPEVNGYTGKWVSASEIEYDLDADGVIKSGDTIEIPLEVVTTSTRTASVYVTGTGNGISNGEVKFADVKGASKTNLTSSNFELTRSNVAEFDLRITESQIATINTGDKIYLELDNPDFEWSKLPTATVSGMGDSASVEVGYDDRDGRLYVKLIDAVQSDNLPASIRFADLTVRTKRDSYGDITVNVYSDKNSVTNEEITVGTFTENGIKVTVDKDAKVPVIKAGRKSLNPGEKSGNEVTSGFDFNNDGDKSDVLVKDVKGNTELDTLSVRVEGTYPGALQVEDELVFTLPEGVVIQAVEIVDAQNVEYKPANALTIAYAGSSALDYFGNEDAYREFATFNDNVFTLDNGTTFESAWDSKTDFQTAALELKFYVTTEYDFSGDINAVVSGRAVNKEEYETAKIAEIKQVVDVKTAVTNIPVGYTNLDTADVVISELEPGIFKSGDEFTLSLRNTSDNNNIYSGLLFARDPKLEVSGGTLTLKGEDGRKVDTAARVNSGDVKNAAVQFGVVGRTTKADDLGVITLSNIQVYADRTVPNTNGSKLKVNLGSSTDNANFSNSTNIEYLTTGGTADTGTGANTADGENYNFNKNVVFTLNSTTVSVDGKDVTQDAAPYVSSKSGSTMIPVRALSEALGVAPENVLWHQPTQSVTIIVSPSRTAQFTLNSDLCYINGVAVPMVAASGAVDVVEYKDNRVYLPVRFLGEKVFQVPVVWEGNTVKFN